MRVIAGRAKGRKLRPVPGDITRPITDRVKEALSLATTPLPLPVSTPEWLSPITSVVPGQLFALYLTLAKGYDPDHPGV